MCVSQKTTGTMSGGGNGGRNKRPSPGREQYSHLLDEMSGCGDMVLLEPLTEDSLVENLRTRYESGEIYVSKREEEVVGGRREAERGK